MKAIFTLKDRSVVSRAKRVGTIPEDIRVDYIVILVTLDCIVAVTHHEFDGSPSVMGHDCVVTVLQIDVYTERLNTV